MDLHRSANESDLRIFIKKIALTSEPVPMGEIVEIVPRYKLGACIPYAKIQRCGKSEIMPVSEDVNTRIGGCELCENSKGVIPRAVIADDELNIM